MPVDRVPALKGLREPIYPVTPLATLMVSAYAHSVGSVSSDTLWDWISAQNADYYTPMQPADARRLTR